MDSPLFLLKVVQHTGKSVNIHSEVRRWQIIVEYLHQLNMLTNYWTQLDIRGSFAKEVLIEDDTEEASSVLLSLNVNAEQLNEGSFKLYNLEKKENFRSSFLRMFLKKVKKTIM